MKLALSARVVCDPKRILADRWAHDTVHALAESLRSARRLAERAKTRKS